MKIHLARFHGKRVIIGQVTERYVTQTVEDRWISWSRGVARDIIGLLMNLSGTAISLHRAGRSISSPKEKQTRTRAGYCTGRNYYGNVHNDQTSLALRYRRLILGTFCVKEGAVEGVSS